MAKISRILIKGAFMQATLISSASNENFKKWRRLNENSRASRKFQATLAEGLHLAQVLLECSARVRSVLLRTNGVSQEAAAMASDINRAKGAKIFVLPDSLYDLVCPVEHGAGITCELPIEEEAWPQQPIAQDALYLDGVQDAGNAGTLIRTAVAAGVKYIAAAPGSAGLWSPKVLRAGMGAHFAATLFENVRAEDLDTLFAGRKLAADARGGRDLFRTEGWEKAPTVWMLGAEGPGLSDAALAQADARFLIPITSDCESLNVGAAAAVCLFEQRRRRLLQGEK